MKIKRIKMSEKLISIYYSMYHHIFILIVVNVYNISQSKATKLK